MTVAKTNSNSN